MAHAGHCLVGDGKYGSEEQFLKDKAERDEREGDEGAAEQSAQEHKWSFLSSLEPRQEWCSQTFLHSPGLNSIDQIANGCLCKLQAWCKPGVLEDTI